MNVTVTTRTPEIMGNLIPSITRKLNEHFEHTRVANPAVYLDEFESRLDGYMIDIAKELDLTVEMCGNDYVFTAKGVHIADRGHTK